ncbi:MAG: hypothetical protein U9N51_03935 [Bacteroidota bacterium]|nr:hypothetical protein [Bacteroidota bacterium]
MKKRLCIILFFSCYFLFVNNAQAQSIGFSYFFPTHGYFSNPIAPVNINLPVKFGNYLQISPGISMNNIGGMSMTGFPDELNSNRALIGPFQSLSMSLVPAIVIPTKSVELELMGGVFGFAGFNQKIMHGNFEDMISEAYNYSSLSSDLNMDKSALGWGYLVGTKLNIRIQNNIWGYIAVKYYMGGQNIGINGVLQYASGENASVYQDVDYPNSELHYHGFEITIGGSMRKK